MDAGLGTEFAVRHHVQVYWQQQQGELIMRFIFGVIVGIVISTVGFSGIARILDNGVGTIKSQSQNLAN
jgi:uncharacterized membrane protein